MNPGIPWWAGIGHSPKLPMEPPNSSRYSPTTEIIPSKDLWDRWREGPRNRTDSRAFLLARLTNLWTGNWDRRRSQWRWVWIPDRGQWAVGLFDVGRV